MCVRQCFLYSSMDGVVGVSGSSCLCIPTYSSSASLFHRHCVVLLSFLRPLFRWGPTLLDFDSYSRSHPHPPCCPRLQSHISDADSSFAVLRGFFVLCRVSSSRPWKKFIVVWGPYIQVLESSMLAQRGSLLRAAIFDARSSAVRMAENHLIVGSQKTTHSSKYALGLCNLEIHRIGCSLVSVYNWCTCAQVDYFLPARCSVCEARL